MKDSAVAIAEVGEPEKRKTSPSFHESLTDASVPAFRRYQRITVGRDGMVALLWYEALVAAFGSLPGAAGLVARRKVFPRILGSVGRKVIFGRNLTVRHGHKIHLGDRVVIDDGAVLDAKGQANQGITVGDDSMISRSAILSCKDGDIRIGRDVSLGINCLVHASRGSNVTIGESVIIAAFTYLVGGGNYRMDRLDIPMKRQGGYSKGGVVIEDHAWIGAHVTILDGVTVGRDSVVAAGAVVHKDVPPFAVVGGVPARLLRQRDARGGRSGSDDPGEL